MGWWRRGATVGALLAVLLGRPAPPAWAARYHAYFCHTPYGNLAPTDGWTGSTSGPYDYAFDDCAGRTTFALTAAMDGQASHPANLSNAVWGFTAAPGLTLAGATLYRHEAVPGGVGPSSAYVSFLATPSLAYDPADVIDNCQANLGCLALGTNDGGFDPSNRVVVGGSGILGAQHLYMEVYCGGVDGQACPPVAGYAAEADLYAADLTLEDDRPPDSYGVGGQLVDGSPQTGPAQVWFRAFDRESGVYAETLSVDGKPVVSRVADENGGRCRVVGQATDGLRDFLGQQPCPGAVSADLTLDTGQIRDGSHTVGIVVDDAAGNPSEVWTGTIVTRNAPQGGAPDVTGLLVQGQRLTVAPGNWYPAASAFTYQWLRCDTAPTDCQPIAGAVDQSYVPGAADDYKRLAVDVTAVNAAGSTTVRTAPLGPVADAGGSTSGGPGSVEAQSGGLAGAGSPAGKPGAGTGGPGVGASAGGAGGAGGGGGG
ncbi:MAG: hypothetical protein LC720_00570, partial [Actinobacteria bacterium]|nr:hypothetical protein [Actinomycetota bacterium]